MSVSAGIICICKVIDEWSRFSIQIARKIPPKTNSSPGELKFTDLPNGILSSQRWPGILHPSLLMDIKWNGPLQYDNKVAVKLSNIVDQCSVLLILKKSQAKTMLNQQCSSIDPSLSGNIQFPRTMICKFQPKMKYQHVTEFYMCRGQIQRRGPIWEPFVARGPAGHLLDMVTS